MGEEMLRTEAGSGDGWWEGGDPRPAALIFEVVVLGRGLERS